MRIISRIIDIFFRTESYGSPTGEDPRNESFDVTEEDIEEAEQIADEMVNDQEEEVNTETCEICGKTFEGETAGQKKGGHKASAHYN